MASFAPVRRRRVGRGDPKGKRKSRRLMLWLLLTAGYLATSALVAPALSERRIFLSLGAVASKDIKAPFDLSVPDEAATEAARRAAEAAVPSVFRIDRSAEEDLFRGLEELRKGDADVLRSMWLGELSEAELAQVVEAAGTVARGLFQRGVASEAQKDLLDLGDARRIIIVDEKGARIGESTTPLTLQEAKEAASAELREVFPDSYKKSEAAAQLLAVLLRPNIRYDADMTRRLKYEAAQAVQPVMAQIRKGEVLIREGERVTPEAYAKLAARNEALGLRLRAAKASATAFTVLLLFVVCCIYYARCMPHLASDLPAVVVLVTSSLLVLALARGVMALGLPEAVTPFALGTMLAVPLVGPQAAVPAAFTTSLLVGLASPSGVGTVLLAAVSSLAGGLAVVGVRRRAELVRAGAVVGLAAILVAVSLEVAGGGRGLTVVEQVAHAATAGLLCSLLAPGLLALYEHALGLASDIRLLELADLSHPLLRELAERAPGTYQSSLAVGSLAEAAARAVGANPLLARVAAYYHDIGKMGKAAYFTENQIDPRLRRKHMKLKAKMSSLILLSHVKDGVALAREHGLPRAIIDIIKEHHGTTLASFFYQRAMEEGEEGISEEDFRYPGPKPQSKEAGIVMLADSVEAASRSLNEPTPTRIRSLVQKIINNKFVDGQLDESGLTLRDLVAISEAFTKVLTGMFHTRIEYPEPEGEDDNGFSQG